MFLPHIYIKFNNVSKTYLSGFFFEYSSMYFDRIKQNNKKQIVITGKCSINQCQKREGQENMLPLGPCLWEGLEI